MSEISYDNLVEKALIHVVQEALKYAEKNGLDNNHFYITFQTNRKDVILSERLKAAYPKEITIVLQHEYYDLKAGDKSFSVTLSFNNISERITVPYNSILRFADPYARFALSFTPENPDIEEEEEEKEIEQKDEKEQENVVSLSAFRKKK